MTLVDAFVVIGIFGSFIFLILSRLNEKNPARVQWFYDLVRGKNKPKELKDRIEQIYPQKRQIM